MDLVIETPGGLLPVEVKSGARLRVGDARHLHTFLAEYPDRSTAGVVLYAGAATYWLTDRVLAVPVSTVL